jgi:hypothetical protein
MIVRTLIASPAWARPVAARQGGNKKRAAVGGAFSVHHFIFRDGPVT